MLWITHHRRFTDNHTWHVNWAGNHLFVKANPHHDEARAERARHDYLREFYPVPRLRRARRVGRWSVLVYDRWPHLGHDSGLLLDEIVHADLTGEVSRLDECLTAVFTQYQRVISRTLQYVTNGDTVSKLYGDRATADGRLDRYYRPNTPWSITNGTRRIRPSDLASLRLVVNGRKHTLDFADLMTRMRLHFARHTPVWAAV